MWKHLHFCVSPFVHLHFSPPDLLLVCIIDIYAQLSLDTFFLKRLYIISVVLDLVMMSSFPLHYVYHQEAC